jgi:putative acetyltransferase
MIRKEQTKDIAAVRALNNATFPTDAEAALVDRLRAEADNCISLVAEVDDQIVGHILFTPVTISDNPHNIRLCGLAPMAVLPARQRSGIGSELVKAGLVACREHGYQIVVVLGHPGYYPRFGFKQACTFDIVSAYDVPEEAFMALELEPGALEQVSGRIDYHVLFESQ